MLVKGKSKENFADREVKGKWTGVGGGGGGGGGLGVPLSVSAVNLLYHTTYSLHTSN